MSQIKSLIIGEHVKTIGAKAFYNCKGLTSISVPESVTKIGSEAFDGTSWYDNQPDGVVYAGKFAYKYKGTMPTGTQLTINDGTLGIADEAFYDCSELTSITVPNGLANIGSNIIPETAMIYTSIGKSLLALWKAGYEGILEIESGVALEKPELSLIKTSPSSLTFSVSKFYPELHETVKSSYFAFGKEITLSKELNSNSDEIIFRGLRPDCNHSTSLTLSIDDVTYTKSFSFKTDSLKFTTQQPKIISLGNVIVGAKSNLEDEETKVGFEWRRTDWTSDFASNEAVGYLYEGMMEGYIRNINTEKLWKYRPYYEADSGNRYYGDWVGIDPTNTSYFEPIVHTYAQITVNGNTAEVKGYAMRGTDNIVTQGFVYWQNRSAYSLRKKAASIPSDAVTVTTAKVNVMTATLEDLEYETEYCCVAFVTTSEDETFYGEPQTFTTSVDPDGIKSLKDSNLNNS